MRDSDGVYEQIQVIESRRYVCLWGWAWRHLADLQCSPCWFPVAVVTKYRGFIDPFVHHCLNITVQLRDKSCYLVVQKLPTLFFKFALAIPYSFHLHVKFRISSLFLRNNLLDNWDYIEYINRFGRIHFIGSVVQFISMLYGSFIQSFSKLLSKTSFKVLGTSMQHIFRKLEVLCT